MEAADFDPRQTDDDDSGPDLHGEAEVEVPIGEELDLHAFSPRDVPSLVEEYLAQSRARGFRRVRIIHGRGTGTQRAIVRSLLARHPDVASYADAEPDLGGWGATIVEFRS